MIGVAGTITEPKRNALTVKEMLREAQKLSHRIRFLVEEVGAQFYSCLSVCVYVCVQRIIYLSAFTIFNNTMLCLMLVSASAHTARCICVDAQ